VVQIPGKAVSALIGSRGAFVADIEKSSGTKIQIEKVDTPSGERTVRVVGPLAGQGLAVQLIQLKVQEWRRFQTGGS
jgi:predicted PilT family ATPase